MSVTRALRKPIIFIPGFAGSRLIHTRKQPVIIKTSKDQFAIRNDFVNLNIFDKEWQDDFKLKFDKSDGVSADDDIDVYEFGGLDGIRNLCYNCTKFDEIISKVLRYEVIQQSYNYKYYDSIINEMEKLGYTAKVDMFGAPYDFRKIMIPVYRDTYWYKLKNLIEEAYSISQKPVVLIAHSLGCLITYLFLTEYCTEAWKMKHISKFVSIAGPYGGTSVSFKTLLSSFPLPRLLREKYSNVVETSSGLVLTIPNILGYSCNDVVVLDKDKNKEYTIDNMYETLPEVTKYIYDNYTKEFIPVFKKDTNIDTIFVTSKQIETDFSYVYDGIDTDTKKEPEHIFTSKGDGIIPVDSLHVHEKSRINFPRYTYKEFNTAQHSSILNDREFIKFVKGVVA